MKPPANDVRLEPQEIRSILCIHVKGTRNPRAYTGLPRELISSRAKWPKVNQCAHFQLAPLARSARQNSLTPTVHYSSLALPMALLPPAGRACCSLHPSFPPQKPRRRCAWQLWDFTNSRQYHNKVRTHTHTRRRCVRLVERGWRSVHSNVWMLEMP